MTGVGEGNFRVKQQLVWRAVHVGFALEFELKHGVCRIRVSDADQGGNWCCVC